MSFNLANLTTAVQVYTYVLYNLWPVLVRLLMSESYIWEILIHKGIYGWHFFQYMWVIYVLALSGKDLFIWKTAYYEVCR